MKTQLKKIKLQTEIKLVEKLSQNPKVNTMPIKAASYEPTFEDLSSEKNFYDDRLSKYLGS